MLTVERIAKALHDARQFVRGDLVTDERGAAWLLGRTARTLRRWREEGRGPRYYETSRILYDLDDLLLHLTGEKSAPDQNLAGDSRPGADI